MLLKDNVSKIYLHTNFREAQASMIPYFIRLAERTAQNQDRPSDNVQRVNSTNSHNLQVIDKLEFQ